METVGGVITWVQGLGWCDPGYENLTPMLTEAFNTLSNVPGIILALIGLINAIHQRFEDRFKMLHLTSVVVGVGSMLLHCSMKLREQHTDEIPMVWIMLLYIYSLYSPCDIPWNHWNSALKVFLIVYGVVFSYCCSKYRSTLGFELHYLFLILVCAPGMVKHYMNTEDALALRLAHQYLLCFSCGMAIWGLDQKFCNRETTLPVHPSWHALFHVLNGLNNYFGNMFLQFSRAHQLGLNPQLRYVGGVPPYVKVIKKDRKTIAIQTEVEKLNKE